MWAKFLGDVATTDVRICITKTGRSADLGGPAVVVNDLSRAAESSTIFHGFSQVKKRVLSMGSSKSWKKEKKQKKHGM